MIPYGCGRCAATKRVCTKAFRARSRALPKVYVTGSSLQLDVEQRYGPLYSDRGCVLPSAERGRLCALHRYAAPRIAATTGAATSFYRLDYHCKTISYVPNIAPDS